MMTVFLECDKLYYGIEVWELNGDVWMLIIWCSVHLHVTRITALVTHTKIIIRIPLLKMSLWIFMLEGKKTNQWTKDPLCALLDK